MSHRAVFSPTAAKSPFEKLSKIKGRVSRWLAPPIDVDKLILDTCQRRPSFAIWRLARFYPVHRQRRQLSKVSTNFSRQYVACILSDITIRVFSKDILAAESALRFPTKVPGRTFAKRISTYLAGDKSCSPRLTRTFALIFC